MFAIFEPNRHLVPISEAAARYHVSEKTLRRRVAEGGLTSYKLGPKALRIDLIEADHVFSGGAA